MCWATPRNKAVRGKRENRRVESRFDQPAGVTFRVFWLLLTGKTLTGKAAGLTEG